MDRERAETYLRLLAEAELRRAATQLPDSASQAGHAARMIRVTQALTAANALDTDVVDQILHEFEVALAARQSGAPGPRGPSLRSVIGSTPWARRRPARPTAEDTSAPARIVPVGQVFHGEEVGGDLHLMSYVHTASGARFTTMSWRERRVSGQRPSGLVRLGQFTVTDDQGASYRLDLMDSEWTGAITVRPEPPREIRWLNLVPPDGPAVRIDLNPESRDSTGPAVTPSQRSPGEHLLNQIAERLLTKAPRFPQDRYGQNSAISRERVTTLADALGSIVAALQVAGLLPPRSPVPGQLATLCESLHLGGHGITAPPARDLPEPWLSMLAGQHRAEPDTISDWDGYATVAAALPEVGGTRITLLDLHNAEGATILHVLANGATPYLLHPETFGIEIEFPVSVWVRDSGGRWHATCPVGREPRNGEWTLRLQLVPPLTRSTAWIEVLAAAQSAQVRATLPLHWSAPGPTMPSVS